MTEGPTAAKSSLLLNYHTPLNVISFIQSLTHGHFSVSLSILGEFLLRSLIAVSTGIFKSEVRTLEGPVSLTTTDYFNLTRMIDEVLYLSPADALWVEHRQNISSPPWLTAQGDAIQSLTTTDCKYYQRLI